MILFKNILKENLIAFMDNSILKENNETCKAYAMGIGGGWMFIHPECLEKGIKKNIRDLESETTTDLDKENAKYGMRECEWSKENGLVDVSCDEECEWCGKKIGEGSLWKESYNNQELYSGKNNKEYQRGYEDGYENGYKDGEKAEYESNKKYNY
jgi:hypothetical protein